MAVTTDAREVVPAIRKRRTAVGSGVGDGVFVAFIVGAVLLLIVACGLVVFWLAN